MDSEQSFKTSSVAPFVEVDENEAQRGASPPVPLAAAPNTSYGATQNLRQLVGNPVADVTEATNTFLSLADFWDDMRRRERTAYHQATVVLGILLFLVAVCYCIVVEVAPKKGADEALLHFLAVELGICGCSQLFYSLWGICLENSPMLFIANLNALGLSIRMAVSLATEQFVPLGYHVAFFVIFTILAMLHLGCSAWAWGGQFSRYMCFVIGADDEIQRMYRAYQLMNAFSAFDLQFGIMSFATLGFFVSHEAWHYIVLVIVGLITAVLRSGLKQVVRRERSPYFAVLAPLYMATPFFIGFALWRHGFLDVDVPESCKHLAEFVAYWYFVVRLFFVAVTGKCIANFGRGMKTAFAKEKTVREYFEDRKKRMLLFTQQYVQGVKA